MNLNFDSNEFNCILNDILANEKVKKDNICSICKDPLLIDTVKLTCGHRYHSSCLQYSFVKYETKKCPLCREFFIWESYKTKCIAKKKNGDVCGKKCYNDEKMCTLHVNTYLRRIEKEKNSLKNKNDKKIKQKKLQLKKLRDKIKILEGEIKLLENKVSL